MNTFSWRTEFLFTLAVILLSLLLLPGMIYLVGSNLFGSYATGLAGMYANHLRGLIQLQWAPWVLSFGPALCAALCRIILRWTVTVKMTPHSPAKRREPRIEA